MKRPKRWWIVDAVAHRQTERAALAAVDEQDLVPEWMKTNGPVEVIKMMPADDDDWCCDYCNGTVRLVDDDGNGLFVPMHEGSALCFECFGRLLPDRGGTPGTRPLGGWSDVVCGCAGCSARLAVLDAESVVAVLAAQIDGGRG
jgi:hypothetical protein